VLDEPGVEDLVDARDRGLPRADPLPCDVEEARIVQDPLRGPGSDGVDAEEPREPTVNELAALVAFAFVGSVSPGPNNTVLWASGLRFGFRRTVPHVLGTALGIGALVVGVGAGLGVLLDAVPAAELVLKLVGSAYLVYVAFLVAGSGAVGRGAVSHPLGLWQAIAFQCLNPKAWIFAVAAVGTFLPPDVHRVAGSVALTGTVMLVVVASSSIWAAGGAALGRVVEDERTRRAVSVGLAALLVASVALIWL
jgi:threonine/homoserine/homoserine lactone efflux protein